MTNLDRNEQRWKMWDYAFSAWAEYQTTGLHVTAEEADAWLTKLEAGDLTLPPKLHT